MVLWGDTKPSFVDMGCGNGLLVHVLNSEGYNGVGLDVRSRKMWTQYPQSTVLKVVMNLILSILKIKCYMAQTKLIVN